MFAFVSFVCYPGYVFRILSRIRGFLVFLVHPQRDCNLPSGQTVGGPRQLSNAKRCPCAVCPCRCSTQISGLCIVVWLGFGPGVSGFNLSLTLCLFLSLSDVNQIVCWLSLRLVSQLQLPRCQYSFPFPFPFPFPVPA